MRSQQGRHRCVSRNHHTFQAYYAQFARYLAEEIHATPISQFANSGSSSDASDDDDEDEDGTGWLARSSPFDFRQPATSPNQQETITSTGFDVKPLLLDGTRSRLY